MLEGLHETHRRFIRYLESDVREVDFAMNRYQLTLDVLNAVDRQIHEVGGEEVDSWDHDGSGSGKGSGGGYGNADDDSSGGGKGSGKGDDEDEDASWFQEVA
jgi:hypothetical protein